MPIISIPPEPNVYANLEQGVQAVQSALNTLEAAVRSLGNSQGPIIHGPILSSEVTGQQS
jgi:hypothetical protein